MRRWAICVAGLAVCLLACGTPQPQEITQDLHGQLYALALQKEPKARWHCRVQWEGEQAWGNGVFRTEPALCVVAAERRLGVGVSDGCSDRELSKPECRSRIDRKKRPFGAKPDGRF